MDAIDRKILNLLHERADMTATELARIIHLSMPAANKRVAKLKNQGVIRRYTLDLDPAQVGKSMIAFTLVVLTPDTTQEDLLAHISTDRDITECHAVDGDYDYLLKIFARDINSFEEKILRLKEKRLVSKTHTMFSLREIKYLPGAAPDEADA